MAKTKGFEQTYRILKALREETEKAAKKGFLKGAELIKEDAITFAPLKMGKLRSSIGVVQAPQGLSTKVQATAKHAPYIEFGTGDYVVAPTGFEDYPIEFFETGLGTTKPQSFLFRSYFKNKEGVVNFVNEELTILFNKLNSK